jgi:outer membrane protein assembly factor BamB
VLGSLKLDDKLIPRSVPVVTSDAVFVLLTDQAVDYRALVALDLKLERVRWRLAAPKPWSTSRAFVWNGTVVVGTASGDVLAYRTADASTAWSHSVVGSVRAIGGTGNTLYVSTRQGTLYAFRQ